VSFQSAGIGLDQSNNDLQSYAIRDLGREVRASSGTRNFASRWLARHCMGGLSLIVEAVAEVIAGDEVRNAEEVLF
jgi:hypothetical protein